MTPSSTQTEAVVRRHLRAFLERRGADEILRDYADDACFLSDGRSYCGKPAIRAFFEGFLAGLAPQTVDRFALRSLRVEGEFAQITWSAVPDIALGTDTFVVRNGRIVAQTFAFQPSAG
jgi:ketosteroid isomerase-like protein